jgi:ubiquitin C-terminal hydrolase
METVNSCGVGISAPLVVWAVLSSSIDWPCPKCRLKARAASLDPMTVTVRIAAIMIAKRFMVSFPQRLDTFNCFSTESSLGEIVVP